MSMKRILLFGNSGSGKSTLAKKLSTQYALPHLDLDTLAWLDTSPPERRPLEESEMAIRYFMAENRCWIIEGCYSDLLQFAVAQADKLIFLNPGIEACVGNCKNRPWEPHKYVSAEEQDNNLPMLLTWVKAYAERDDDFSLCSHQRLFNAYSGSKEQLTSNAMVLQVYGE